MKKQEQIRLANKDFNPVWALVEILEKEGKIEKNKNKIRKPAVYITKTQMLLSLSNTEILIVERASATGEIINYRLIKYDLENDKVEGAYNPFKEK